LSTGGDDDHASPAVPPPAMGDLLSFDDDDDQTSNNPSNVFGNDDNILQVSVELSSPPLSSYEESVSKYANPSVQKAEATISGILSKKKVSDVEVKQSKELMTRIVQPPASSDEKLNKMNNRRSNSVTFQKTATVSGNDDDDNEVNEYENPFLKPTGNIPIKEAQMLEASARSNFSKQNSNLSGNEEEDELRSTLADDSDAYMEVSN